MSLGMDERVTNLVYALFTGFGRIGQLRFIAISLTIILSLFLFLVLDPDFVRRDVYKVVLLVFSWCWLMQFIKRGHDFGAPAWVSLLVFFASVFLIPALFWAVMPGRARLNPAAHIQQVPLVPDQCRTRSKLPSELHLR